MFNKYFFILVLPLLFIFSGCAHDKKAEIKIGDEYLCQADIADNIISQAQGLSGREALTENECMLFVFEKSETRTFWMKDMNFPLDIIFIENNEIVEIKENLEVPNNNIIPQYFSKNPANMVLEVKKGIVDEHNLKKGDKISIDS